MPFDPTKPVRTRDGRPARIITTERKCPMGQNIVALVSAMDPYAEEIAVFTSDGSGTCGGGLVNVATPTIIIWVNIYHDPLLVCLPYLTRQAADSVPGGRIACVEIEYAEGEGL